MRMATGLRRVWLAGIGAALAWVASANLLAKGPETAAQEAAQAPHTGGEANLVLPDLGSVTFQGIDGHTLLLGGLVVCALGLIFGLVINRQLKNLPVHPSMLEISELIYETCKTYLIQQGKFLLLLEIFIGIIIAFYFGALQHFPLTKVAIILFFSLVGIAGSYGVAWFGIRVNTYANSRTAFAALQGKPYPCYAIPLKAGMSIGMLLISVELVIMLLILLFIPGPRMSLSLCGVLSILAYDHSSFTTFHAESRRHFEWRGSRTKTTKFFGTVQ